MNKETWNPALSAFSGPHQDNTATAQYNMNLKSVSLFDFFWFNHKMVPQHVKTQMAARSQLGDVLLDVYFTVVQPAVKTTTTQGDLWNVNESTYFWALTIKSLCFKMLVASTHFIHFSNQNLKVDTLMSPAAHRDHTMKPESPVLPEDLVPQVYWVSHWATDGTTLLSCVPVKMNWYMTKDKKIN